MTMAKTMKQGKRNATAEKAVEAIDPSDWCRPLRLLIVGDAKGGVGKTVLPLAVMEALSVEALAGKHRIHRKRRA